MSDFTLVDPKGWQYDLHSVYSAYIGYFQINNVPWYERSWGHLFSSFEDFLAFSWPVIVVTDAWTGKAHIVTRLNSIGTFLKMIKTRFGETLPQAPNILEVTPFETSNRHLRNVSDYNTYRKLHNTLPAAILSALKQRIRNGEPKAIKELWDKRDKTFLSMDFEWSERNEKSCLEWGYAAIRCGHLNSLGHWPPVPDTNYRKGHFIMQEYADKAVNKYCPNYPWHYAFGDSQVMSKTKLPQVIQAVISSLASPDSETIPNNLVLVVHGASGDLARMEEMKIKLPHNMLIIDISVYERVLFSQNLRHPMADPKTGLYPRQPNTTLSLENLLRSLTHPAPLLNGTTTTTTAMTTAPQEAPKPLPVNLPNVMMHNAGNDAFLMLFALQMLLEPEGTKVPTITNQGVKRAMAQAQAQAVAVQHAQQAAGMMMGGVGGGANGLMGMIPQMSMPPGMGMGMGMGGMAPGISVSMSMSMGPQGVGVGGGGMKVQKPRLSVYDLSNEFGQMRVDPGSAGVPSPMGNGTFNGKRSGSKSPGDPTRLSPGTPGFGAGKTNSGSGNGSRSSRRLSGFDWGV